VCGCEFQLVLKREGEGKFECGKSVNKTMSAMRFTDSGKFPDLFHSPKVKILRIGNLAKYSGEGVGE
jgi:hypothetical protein